MRAGKALKVLFAVIALASCSLLSGQTSSLDSLACLQSNDGVVELTQSGVSGVYYDSSQYQVGDYLSWIDSNYYATVAYLSFPAPTLPANHRLAAASLYCYVVYCVGNSQMNAYPSFEFQGGTIIPNCLLTHVDYGATLEIADYGTAGLHDPANFFNSYIQGWNWIDVTPFVQDDLDNGRTYSQYQLRLQLLSDWGGGDDYIVFAGAAMNGYNPYLHLEYAPLTSSSDNLLPAPLITAGPNPFRECLSISLLGKTAQPSQIGVYNLKGQKVASLPWPNGTPNIVWTGSDGSGRQTPPGIYLLRWRSGAKTGQIKVVKLP